MFFQFYVMPCIMPLIVGIGLLANSRSAPTRLLALLTLKPVVGTSLWLLSIFLFRDNLIREPISLAVLPLFNVPIRLAWQMLITLPLIGLGLTAAILWISRASLRTISPLTLALLLVLDTLRWGSAYLNDLRHGNSLDTFATVAMSMPTIFAVVVWVLWLCSQRSSLQNRTSGDDIESKPA